jgi:hypothetical protein
MGDAREVLMGSMLFVALRFIDGRYSGAYFGGGFQLNARQK